MTVRLTMRELPGCRDLDLGASAWFVVDQLRIDHFAEATDDAQWIHIDPQRAAAGPFGGTVAHGYLIMSLLPHLFEGLLDVTDRRMGVNYGIDRLRLVAPVPAGARIRLKAVLGSVEARGEGLLLRVAAEVEIEHGPKPALVGDVLFMVL